MTLSRASGCVDAWLREANAHAWCGGLGRLAASPLVVMAQLDGRGVITCPQIRGAPIRRVRCRCRHARHELG